MNFNWTDGIFEKYGELAHKDISLVPEPSRTVIAIFAAHGKNGSGGFKMLFESNLMDGNGLEVIIESYRNLGLEKHAQKIEGLIALFPHGELPEKVDDICEFISNVYSGDNKHAQQFDKAEELFYENHEKPYEITKNYYESKDL